MRKGVDLDVVVVAVAVARVLPQVSRQLPRRIAVVEVRLRRPPVHYRMQACMMAQLLTCETGERVLLF